MLRLTINLDLLRYPGYLSLILSVSCGLIQIILLISLIRQTQNKLPNSSILIAYLSILFFIIYDIGILAESFYVIIEPNAYNCILCAINFLFSWLYKTGEILMYLFYINRLSGIFSETMFRYNKTRLFIFSLFIVFGFYVNNFITTFVVFQNIHNIQRIQDCILAINEYHNSNYTFTFVSAIFAVIVETIASIILLRLYLKNLALLSLAYDHYEFTSQGHKQKNEKFLDLILKITTLVIVALITSYLALILLMTEFGGFILIIDHTIIAICIYLGYGANDKLYHKSCCFCNKVCHKCCIVICFCCCVPTHIDDTLEVAITENSSRHRFKSVSLTAHVQKPQIRRYSTTFSRTRSKGGSHITNCNEHDGQSPNTRITMSTITMSTITMSTIKDIDLNDNQAMPSEIDDKPNNDNIYHEMDTKEHSLSIIAGNDDELSFDKILDIDLILQ